MPRDLTPNERALLDWLLRESSIPQADDLRAQIPFARVVERGSDLPTWLYFEVSGATPVACRDGNVASCVVEDSSGEATGFLELWVENGVLSALEHPWVTDEMPQAFPSVEQLRPWRPDEIHDVRR
jgi:hypothetical protein